MSQYFDKDFFKLLLGFAAIITISCVIILAAKLYESKQPAQTVSAEQIKK